MPEEELFLLTEVSVSIPPEDMPGRPHGRVRCELCSEHVQDRREVLKGGRKVLLVPRQYASGGVRFGDRWIERHCALDMRLGFGLEACQPIGNRQLRMSERVFRIDRYGLLEFTRGAPGVPARQQVSPPQVSIMGLRVHRRSGSRGFVDVEIDRVAQRIDDGRRDLILNREDVIELSVIPLGPNMATRRAINELCRNA